MKMAIEEQSTSARLASTMPPTVSPGVPPDHDLTWHVQRAWSVFRLPRLQELIRSTIVSMQSLPRPGAAGPYSTADGAHDPVAEALRACCDELRDASGMPGAEAERARHCQEVRDYIARQPPAWSEAFAEALLEYRKAAGRSLETTFRKSTAA